VNGQTNPDERFDQVESTLNQLAEENVKLAEKTRVVADKVDALVDIVQRWYERHGNGSSGQHPS
jgi:hypothetical protein